MKCQLIRVRTNEVRSDDEDEDETRTINNRIYRSQSQQRRQSLPRLLQLVVYLIFITFTFVFGQVTPTKFPLPSTLVATWVNLTGVALNDPILGIRPEPRCDHALFNLGGKSLKPNAGIPFPNGVTPQVDPYQNKLWLFGGHGLSSVHFEESWFLDIGLSPPVWNYRNFSNTTDKWHGRYAIPITFIPNGLHPEDVGLCALAFGGTGADYTDEIWTYNFASNTLRIIVPESGDHLGQPGGPFARSWNEMNPLPLGYGTNAISSTVDSGTHLMIGGDGASDGVRYSPSDHDWDEEWKLTINATNGAQPFWAKFGDFLCSQTTVKCKDARPLWNYTSSLTNAYDASKLDLTASYRPATAYAALQSFSTNLTTVENALSNSLSTMSPSSPTFINTPNACTTICLDSTLDRTSYQYPPKLEGYRSVSLGGQLFLFGGYSCVYNGQQSVGGVDCFSAGVWVLNYTSMNWTEHLPPTSDSPYADFAQYWPNPRCYGVAVAYEAQNLILFQGGAFQTDDAVWAFYNDVYAFDTTIMQFVPIQANGIPPKVGWSSAAAIQDNNMYLFGGCVVSDSTGINDQLFMLRVGVAVGAENCSVTGSGLYSSIAGVKSFFWIQTRESIVLPNDVTATHPDSIFIPGLNHTIVWGQNATYGTGLSFSVQLITVGGSGGGSVATGDVKSNVNLVQGKVNEEHSGRYRVSYTAKYGSDFKVFISLGETSLPGSPFSMRLLPEAIATSATTTATGNGLSLVEKGSKATAVIQFNDEYGNSFTDNRFLSPSSNSSASQWNDTNGQPFLVTASIGLSLTDLTPTAVTLINNHNGTFNLSYSVPSDYDQFLLGIELNGAPISGSPFSVQGLTPIKVSRDWHIVFWVISFVIIAMDVVFSVLVMIYRHEPVLRSSSPNFLQVLILGSIMCSLSVVFLTMDDQDYGCQCFPALLSIGLVVSMSALLAKSHRVMRIFTASKLKVQSGLSDSHLMIPTIIASLLMVLINVLWIVLSPIKSVRLPSQNYPTVLSWSSCQGSSIALWLGLVLCYCGCILLYGVYLAVKTGHVPEAFNESKLIAASVYNIFFCSIIVVPLMFFIGSSSDFIIGRLVIQSTVILWCSVFNVVSIIGPKLLIQLKLTAPPVKVSSPGFGPSSSSSGNAPPSGMARRQQLAAQGTGNQVTPTTSKTGSIRPTSSPTHSGVNGSVAARTNSVGGGANASAANSTTGRSSLRKYEPPSFLKKTTGGPATNGGRPMSQSVTIAPTSSAAAAAISSTAPKVAAAASSTQSATTQPTSSAYTSNNNDVKVSNSPSTVPLFRTLSTLKSITPPPPSSDIPSHDGATDSSPSSLPPIAPYPFLAGSSTNIVSASDVVVELQPIMANGTQESDVPASPSPIPDQVRDQGELLQPLPKTDQSEKDTSSTPLFTAANSSPSTKTRRPTRIKPDPSTTTLAPTSSGSSSSRSRSPSATPRIIPSSPGCPVDADLPMTAMEVDVNGNMKITTPLPSARRASPSKFLRTGSTASATTVATPIRAPPAVTQPITVVPFTSSTTAATSSPAAPASTAAPPRARIPVASVLARTPSATEFMRQLQQKKQASTNKP